MSRSRHLLAATSLLGIMAIGLASPASSRAAAAPPVFYEGSVASGALTWTRAADGTVSPVLPDTRALAETGRPALAERDLLLLVPADASIGGVEVEALATHQVAAPGPWALGTQLASSEGQSVTVADLPLADAAYPAQWGAYGGSHFLRGFRMVGVRIFPLRALRDASGAWSSVEVLDRYAVRLLPAPAGAPAPDVAERARRLPGERARTDAELASMIANPEALGGYVRPDGVDVPAVSGGFAPTLVPSLSGSPVSYLIITNEALAPQFQRLADHRTARGMPAVVKTIEWIQANYRHGADLQETIRMFIRAAYVNWGIDYVLLGGDTDILPPRYVRSTYYPPAGSTDIPADLYFACLDGNWDGDKDAIFGEPYMNGTDVGDSADLANEIAVGRATMSTPAAAGAYVDKVIAYESEPVGAAFADRALFAGEVLFPEDYHPGDTILLDGSSFTQQVIDTCLTPPGCSQMAYARLYENYPAYPGSVPLNRAAVFDSLNSGRYGVFNQVGHGYFYNMSVGDRNFVNADADALTNAHYFLIYALNCASAAFDYSCLLERFLQNPHGGAIAAVGSARAAFPYTIAYYQLDFFQQLTCNGVRRVGDLMGLSRLHALGNTYYNSVDRWTFFNYTLLGDPALSLWTAAPRLAGIAAPASLGLGPQSVDVTVTSGGSPVAGAMVCLAKAGDDYASGVTGPTGLVTLAYNPASTGTATLTVSEAGLAAATRSLPVTASGPFIAIDSVNIVDNGTGGSAGNGDARLDAGETVAVWAQYRDTGGGGANNCTATLASADPGVTILDGTAAVGNVPAGGAKSATEPFLVQIAPSVADGTHLTFTVTVTASGGGGPWTSEWRPVVTAPQIEPIALTWSDAAYGNNNGVPESGERVTVTLKLKNFGAGLSGNLTMRLRTSDPAVTIYDSVATCPSLALVQQGTNAGVLSFAESSVSPHHWCRIVITDTWGRTVRHSFLLGSPAVPSGIITDSTLGPDVIALSWNPVIQARQRGYNVYRGTSAAGPFLRANVDIVDGISYFRDAGLSLLTPYYYRITSIDSTLMESAQSAVIMQSTAPPEASGFPLPINTETSGHLAVGDVDGDGTLEVVLGADQVYVWTATGGELMDGDHNAQTLGPISNIPSGGFSPAGLALANLDGEPGLEIIASERTQNKIHIYRKDGTELPGWPRPLADATHWNWTTPAVGDIDGDGSPEIVLNDIYGRTYAWHVNGSEVRDGDNNPATQGVFVARADATGEWGWSSPALYDLDGDGAKEIIFGTKLPSNNKLFAYKYNGTQAPGFPISVNGTIVCSPSIGDLDGDGVAEIVFVSGDDLLWAVRQNGTNYPGFPVAFVSNDNDTSCPSPALADFDGDGKLEIVAVSTVTGTNCNVKVISTNVALGTSGQTLPGWPRFVPGNSESSPVVGDIDGDGVPDIVYGIGGGNESTPNNLYAWKADGTAIPGFPITLGGPIRPSPTICDLDHDGKVNIVYGGWDLQIHVWSMPFTYHGDKMPWPTFRGNIGRDGVYRRASPTAVPQTPQPVPAALTVAPSFPNPFNPSTTVRLYLPAAAGQTAPLRLGIYDIQGRLVRTLHDGPAAGGWSTWLWDGRDGRGRSQPSGLYFLRAQSGAVVRTQKLALVK